MTHVIEVPFHIGDFLSGTMHMDATEIGAYWMLCVAHYQAGEQGLPDDDIKLARIAKISLKTWKRIRPTVEAKFTITDSFWRSSKVVDVLRKISARSSNAKANALKRWNEGDATALPEQCNGNANHKPITNIEDTYVSSNKRAPEKSKDVSRGTVEQPEDVADDVWKDFSMLRRKKGAPLTATALAQIRREAHAAAWSLNDALRECCARGWQGFKADWVRKDTSDGNRNGNSGNRDQERKSAFDSLANGFAKAPPRKPVDGW